MTRTDRASDWGLTRQECFPLALDPACALLDERGISEFLAMAPRYAKLLNFYDLTGTVSDDWVPFFSSDISFLLADICSVHRPDDESDHGVPPNASDTTLLLHRISTIAHRIDHWYQRAQAHDLLHLDRAVAPITQTLSAAILQDLAPLVRQIEGQNAYANQWRAMESRHPMSPIWNEVPGDDDGTTRAPHELLAILASFEAALAKLAVVARSYLEDTLTRSDHVPHATLYLAFLELYKCLQADMNQFTERHLDYYYNTILELTAAPAQADNVALVFQLQPTCPAYTLPAGTQFNAGKDSGGADIVFATDIDVALNQTTITSLRTLYVERADTPQAPVLSLQAAPAANSADGLGAPLADPNVGWSTFGVSCGAPDAELGFLIASPALALGQGEREISLRFSFAGDSAADLIAAYAAEAATVYEGPEPLTPEQALENAFLLYVSTAAGWTQIATFRFCADQTSREWILSFALAASDPALQANAALAPAVNGWPMLKLVLNPVAYVYAYSDLQGLALAGLQLQVAVQGLAGAQIENCDGKIAPGKPFPPFGSVPQSGAAFQISHPELSAKRVTGATVTITWQNLPPDTGGFATYYQGYQPYNFANSVFQAEAACWSAGAWVQQAASYPLFAQNNLQVLLPQSQFALDFSALDWSWQSYTDAAQAGATVPATMQFTLTDPPYAFGNALYPRLFAETAIKNIKIIQDEIKNDIGKKLFGTSETIVMLNPPFVPLASGIVIDYQASDQIVLSTMQNSAEPLQFYQIHPFGYAPSEQIQPGLFPQYPNNGYLYIGLSGAAPPQSVNLLFQIRPVAGSEVEAVPGQDDPALPILQWSYLSGNRWLAFDATDVTSATTEFTGSGIVTLQLPPDLTGGDGVMSAKPPLCWIQAATPGDPAAYGNTVAILPQAASATRDLSANAAPPVLPLPAASVTKPIQALAQVKSVSQPFDSVGGSQAESTQQYQARISARLRHKQRASQARDYEQIVLAAFPALSQTKCIGPNNSRLFSPASRVAPGQIVLAVTPAVGPAPQQALPLDGSMLTAIASELQAVASPSVSSITVRNVCYEYLKVFVTVSFKANEDSGLCQQQLNEVLINALSPWCSQTLPHLDIGCGIAYVDQLANLIRNQPYVAQQSAVCIAQTWQTGETHHLRWVNEGQAATPTTPWSVLVSAAEHGIELASGDQVPTEPPEGIGSMTVGADFIVEASHLLGAPPPRTGYNYVLAMRVPGAARPGPAPKPSPSQP